MVQSTTRSANNNIISDQHDTNLDVATANAFAIVLDVDGRYTKDSVITIYNTHASASITYNIWGLVAEYPGTALTGTADTDYDNGWVELVADAALAAGAAPPVLTVGTPYSRVVVRAKSTVTDTPGTVRVRHRGEYRT